ncbi:phosphatidate cytidylyltransferase [Melghiribacillus thermohalophilus]|uniref:Phosphatidate cytidylyltransferase n=1 Tax=Melghiribacillus thermohalophilus TaxID=1324956 RepID=A0A4R3NAW9_9BACI|nr:phosphatidate cytidylyltransferase [Melghiribacillus thermohalophilus]TCT26737.1 phosphatidate cytidylyltransferase [Melghiribacillus thermohalophilus]
MKQRVITAIVALLFFIPILIFGSWPFKLLVFVMATIAILELVSMKNIPFFSFPTILSLLLLWSLMLNDEILDLTHSLTFSKIDLTISAIILLFMYMVLMKNQFTFDDAGFMLLATIYVGMGFYYFIEAREHGLQYVLYILFVIWATDTGAIFSGKYFGKRKLWPEISPKKTVEGSVGGIISAVVVGLIFQLVVPVHSSMFIVLILSVLISVFGQIGDLVESAIKRKYAVKDSGNILPGHGGILDRFDSLLFVLPILHLLQFI